MRTMWTLDAPAAVAKHPKHAEAAHRPQGPSPDNTQGGTGASGQPPHRHQGGENVEDRGRWTEPQRQAAVRARRRAGLRMTPYAVFLLYMTAILGFVAVMLLANKVLGPKPRASEIKLEPFECGATPIETLNVKAVPIRYYALAIIFVLFDLETVFLFLWALGAQPLTGEMVATFGIFVALLVLILLYVYKARFIEAVSE
jgi:NADH-quinone oxidoreductase subunit A